MDDTDKDQAARSRLIRFGTLEPAPLGDRLDVGALAFTLSAGAVRWIAFHGTEVVRAIDYPIRDENWGTLSTKTTEEDLSSGTQHVRYLRDFTAGDVFKGRLLVRAEADEAKGELIAELTLTALKHTTVNRAGFVVLHPLEGVVGEPVTLTRPDGTTEALTFPDDISPSQPVFDIAGLSQKVGGIDAEIRFEGEVFEMEDQRNWTDASYKTYCRPLGLPRPFAVDKGETIKQVIRVELSGSPAEKAVSAGTATGRMPDLLLALDSTIAPPDAAAGVLSNLPVEGVQLRTVPDRAEKDIEAAIKFAVPLDLELVVPEGADPSDAMAALARACEAAHTSPRRVSALQAEYLASIQPEGPWPQAEPREAAEAARAAFPNAEIGAGMLTNFTEFNRKRPDFASDYVTFGTNAIVHAADDASVVETLDALPYVFRSASKIGGGQAVRLSLTTIAMRSNPYGADVIDNPEGARIAMAREDPRHRALFAGAFAVGVIAAAVETGVKSLAPAMNVGPLGLFAKDGSAVTPLFHVVVAAGGLRGRDVTVRRHEGLITIVADGEGLRGIAANLGTANQTLDHGGEALVLSPQTEAIGARRFLDSGAKLSGPLTLEPFDIAFLFAGEDRP